MALNVGDQPPGLQTHIYTVSWTLVPLLKVFIMAANDRFWWFTPLQIATTVVAGMNCGASALQSPLVGSIFNRGADLIRLADRSLTIPDLAHAPRRR